ncbi:MAG: hypothetical protein ACAH80_15495 [Alphaproteobacteria bacterium]
MRGAKILVTVLTTLIFACMGLIVYGFVVKNPFKPVGENMSVTLPAVGDIRMMSGYAGGLALYVVSPEGEWIYFVDPRQKGEAAKVKIERAAASPASDPSAASPAQ